MIEVTSLTKKYGTVTAVDGVDFTINPGEVVGLLGPNGAGKTSIMKVLTCYHYPTSGTVRIFGHDVYADELSVKNVLGYLPENAPGYPEFTVREYLAFVADARIGKGTTPSGLNAIQAVAKAVERCGLGEMLDRAVDNLSKGFRQRLGLAQAILHEPQLLVLDEPTTGLDPNQILEIRRLIRELREGRTIILSTHILQEVEAVCDRVLIMNQGRIVANGTTQDIVEELRGEAHFELVIQGNEAAFLKALADLPGIRKVEPDTLVLGHVGEIPATIRKTVTGLRVRIGLENGSDWRFRTGLTALANANAVAILHLASRSASLEDVFVSLTSDNKEANHGQ